MAFRLSRLAALVCLLGACTAPEPELVRHRVLAMATWVDVLVDASAAGQADAAMRTLEPWLHAFEQDYYAWAPAGELARLNAALQQGQGMTVSPAMADLLGQAQALSAASGGLFDPGVGALVALWGFNSPLPESWQPPAPSAIDTVLAAHASILALRIDGTRISSGQAELLLDLGAIAKGYAVDYMLTALRDAGIRNALVNAGGDLRAMGCHGDRPWRIGIQNPRGDGLIQAVRLLDGEAAFTSGDYERFTVAGTERWHHLLDPGTGRPATHTRSVTVIARDGVTADAAATAIFVAGPERWESVADAMAVDAVLRVDASGRIEMTDAMRDRLEPMAGAGSDILYSSEPRE
jgi:thiamine biosynthesis lipoprotein